MIVIKTKEDCEVHTGRHSPRPHVNHIHHIRPKEYGGADKADNKRVACPTGHYNVHQYLDALIEWDKANPGKPMPYDYTRYFTKGERELAEEGFKRIKENTHGR